MISINVTMMLVVIGVLERVSNGLRKRMKGLKDNGRINTIEEVTVKRTRIRVSEF